MNRPYTEKEIRMIRRRYPTESTVTLATKLDRSPNALRAKALALGLKKVDGKTTIRKPLGSITHRNNIIFIKTKSTGCCSNDWERLDHLIWAASYGPIPPKHVLVFKDGNRKNIALENLECVPRKKIAMQNFAHGQTALVPILALCAELKKRINERTGNKRRKS